MCRTVVLSGDSLENRNEYDSQVIFRHETTFGDFRVDHFSDFSARMKPFENKDLSRGNAAPKRGHNLKGQNISVRVAESHQIAHRNIWRRTGNNDSVQYLVFLCSSEAAAFVHPVYQLWNGRLLTTVWKILGFFLCYYYWKLAPLHQFLVTFVHSV